MGGHPVPLPVSPALEGEVLPPAEKYLITADPALTQRIAAFDDECRRMYREVSDDLGGDPLARDVQAQLLRTVLDPFSRVSNIPKRYRTNDAQPKPQGLTLRTRST